MLGMNASPKRALMACWARHPVQWAGTTTEGAPSAAHTVKLWESARHSAVFGRGVVRISEIPALATLQLAMLAHVDDEPTARFGHRSERRPTT